METNINPTIAKILQWMQQNTNINFPESYDKEKIVDMANYICKKHLTYEKEQFVSYAAQLHFPKETINVYIKEIEKAMKRKIHSTRVVNFDHILTLEEQIK
jgi:hypothetical protein